MSINMAKETKNSGGKGRKSLEVTEGFGRAVYELMQLKRSDETGLAWGTKELAAACGVSRNAAREWIGGRLPRANQLLMLARALDSSCDDLLRAAEMGDISHISTIPQTIRTSDAERVAAIHDVPQKRQKRSSGEH